MGTISNSRSYPWVVPNAVDTNSDAFKVRLLNRGAAGTTGEELGIHTQLLGCSFPAISGMPSAAPPLRPSHSDSPLLRTQGRPETQMFSSIHQFHYCPTRDSNYKELDDVWIVAENSMCHDPPEE